MHIRKATLLAFGLLAVFVWGCSTTLVDLPYESSAVVPTVRPAAHRVEVGPFADERGTSETHLGSIRSGIGNPMKRLVLERPASEVVADAFREALKRRGLLADDDEKTPFILSGTITKLDCNQWSRREAHVHLDVQLTPTSARRVIFEDTFTSVLVEGGGLGGPFGSVEGLRALADRALSQTVDAAVDDPRLRDALSR